MSSGCGGRLVLDTVCGMSVLATPFLPHTRNQWWGLLSIGGMKTSVTSKEALLVITLSSHFLMDEADGITSSLLMLLRPARTMKQMYISGLVLNIKNIRDRVSALLDSLYSTKEDWLWCGEHCNRKEFLTDSAWPDGWERSLLRRLYLCWDWKMSWKEGRGHLANTISWPTQLQFPTSSSCLTLPYKLLRKMCSLRPPSSWGCHTTWFWLTRQWQKSLRRVALP